MNPANYYTKAIQQLRDLGYVTPEVSIHLSAEDLQRAIEEASKPA